MSRQTEANQTNLNIDNVVATQPELGPTPPDGGYGWIILICTIVVQLTVPSVTVAYGMLILYSNLMTEYEEDQIFTLWENKIALVPILMLVFSLLSASWSKSIVMISNRPRLVSISGIFIVTAGVLISSIGVETPEDAIIFNVFAGILAGIGSSLTTHQSEILLKHYFTNKYHIVRAIHKTSITFGSMLITLITGALFLHVGSRYGLSIYSAIIMHTIFALIGFSRPTYITAPLQKSYKVLKEASEDEDEEIYSSENEPTTSRANTTPENTNKNNLGVINTAKDEDDDLDEEIISTFNNKNITKEVIQPSAAAISRLETPRQNNPFQPRSFTERMIHIEPQDSLYRETTVANIEAENNTFTFDAAATSGTRRRTANIKKDALILLSALKDKRFYVFTFINLNVKFSMLIMSLLFPAYVSQQLPEMDLWTVTGLVVVVYMGSICLNIIIAFIPNYSNRRFFLALFSLFAFSGLLGLAESGSKTWILITGTWTVFSVIALYTVLQPITEDMKLEEEATVVYSVSNCLIAGVIFLILIAHDYQYDTLFKIAGSLHMFSPVLALTMLRRY